MHESAPLTTATDGTDGDSDQIAYDLTSAGEKLHLSRRKMYDLCETGEIESFKVGTARRITRRALLDFVERKKRESAS